MKRPGSWTQKIRRPGTTSPITTAKTARSPTLSLYYAKAIELDPAESVYYQNLATTVYLFRKDAKEFYDINEQQVFDKSLALYHKAVQLDPDNFPLATDYAQSYYGIRPLRTNDALVAWTNALKSPTTTSSAKAFISISRGSKSPPDVTPKPARNLTP